MPTRLGTNLVLGGSGPVPPGPPLVSAPPGRSTKWVGGGGRKGPWPGAEYVSATVTTVAAFSDPHTFNLPTVAIGDRIVLVCSILDSLAATTPVTDMSAWTQFLASELNAFHTWRGWTIYIADAAMVTAWSGGTVVVNSDNGGKSTAVAVRIANGASGAIDVAWDHSGPSATGGTNQVDPPQLVPGWSGTSGYDDHNLWLTFATFGSGGSTATSQPQDYQGMVQGSPTGSCVTAVAWRQTIAGGEDPGAFQLSGFENNQALTFAVRPVQPTVPVEGGGRLGVGSRMAATNLKLALGAGRQATPLVAASSPTKVASGAGAVRMSLTARAAGSKVAAAAGRLGQAGLLQGVGTVIGPVAGFGRLALGVVFRGSGSKVAVGGGRAGLQVSSQATPGKVGFGGGRQGSAAVQRSAAAKVAAGGGRSGLVVSFTTTAAKLATGGAGRLGQAGLLQGVGTQVGGAVAGFGRLALGVVFRGSGTKVATGAGRLSGQATATTTGGKVGSGAGRHAAVVVARANGQKVATPSATLGVSAVGRATGSRTAAGGGRAGLAMSARAAGSKSAQGAASLRGGILALPLARKVATAAGRLVGALVGRAEPGSQTPPLPVAHRATAAARHRAQAELRQSSTGTPAHQAMGRSRHGVEATTRHQAACRRL